MHLTENHFTYKAKVRTSWCRRVQYYVILIYKVSDRSLYETYFISIISSCCHHIVQPFNQKSPHKVRQLIHFSRFNNTFATFLTLILVTFRTCQLPWNIIFSCVQSDFLSCTKMRALPKKTSSTGVQKLAIFGPHCSCSPLTLMSK